MSELERRILRNYDPKILEFSSESEAEEEQPAAKSSPEFRSPVEEARRGGEMRSNDRGVLRTSEKETNPGGKKSLAGGFGRRLEMGHNGRYTEQAT